MQHEFIISGDHFQIYVEDENSNADTSEIWNNQTSNDMLAVASGLIAVGTIRYGGDVALTVEVLDRRPTDPLEHCDQVAECSINISSGRIVISSPEGELSKAPRITVPPGTYRALVDCQPFGRPDKGRTHTTTGSIRPKWAKARRRSSKGCDGAGNASSGGQYCACMMRRGSRRTVASSIAPSRRRGGPR